MQPMTAFTTASALACCLLISAMRADAATAVTLPGDTIVPVHLVSSVSSSSTKPGQTFQIIATSPTVVHGWIVFKKGAPGQGRVVSATPAGKSGRQGTLSIRFEWLYAADGQRIPLAGILRNTTGQNKTGSSNAANVAGTILLGPVGLFAHNFVKGKDITVGSDVKFEAYTKSTVTILANRKYTSGL